MADSLVQNRTLGSSLLSRPLPQFSGNPMFDPQGFMNFQRDAALQRFEDIPAVFDSALGQQSRQAIQEGLQGGGEQTDRLFSRLFENTQAEEQASVQRIRDDFAARGLAGSSAQAGVERAARQAASDARTRGMADILLQRFGQAQQNALSMLGAQAAAVGQAASGQAQIRAQSRVTIPEAPPPDPNAVNTNVTETLGARAARNRGRSHASTRFIQPGGSFGTIRNY